jgi:hypothetical protein
MGFADWGMSKEESERRQREHEAELTRIQREGAAAVARINEEIRISNEAHANYRRWMQSTGRTDVPFEDWLAGRYVHVVVGQAY